MGLPSRNRRRSSASALADWYRRAGSFSRHFRQIVSKSRGIRAYPSERILGGSSSSIIFTSTGMFCSRNGHDTGEQFVKDNTEGIDVGTPVRFV